MTAPMPDLAAIVEEAERLEREATMPAAKWEPVEKGRIYLADGGMIASIREQIPDDVDPDGDDPKAWEIGDRAVDEAALLAELVAYLVNHRATLLAVAKAAVEAERLTAIFQRDYITAPPDADSTAWTQRAWAASGEADDAIERLFAAVRGEGKETT